MKIELRAEDGTTNSFESREAQRVWVQTVLLPVMPFASPEARAVEAIYDLTLDALATAQRAGLL